MTNKFIAIEGVDGSGKTTIARELASQIGGVYMKTPGKGFKPARTYIDNGTPPDSKLLYYLSSVFDAAAQIGRTLETQPVVCGRYVFSTLIPHSAYHGRDFEELEDELQPFTSRLLKPDQTILLVVNEGEQLSRLGQDRGLESPTASDQFCLQTPLRRKVRELYEIVAEREGWMQVDTTDRGVQSVMQEINQSRLVAQ
jgi:thymidylate kinase